MKLMLSITVAVAATLIASPVIQSAPNLQSLKDTALYQHARTPLHLLVSQDSQWLTQGSLSSASAFGSAGQHGFAAKDAGQLMASSRAGLREEARLEQVVPTLYSAILDAAHCGSAWSSSTAIEESSNTPSRECTGSQQSIDHASHELLQLQASTTLLRKRSKAATLAAQSISARRKARRRHKRATKADVEANAGRSSLLNSLRLTRSNVHTLWSVLLDGILWLALPFLGLARACRARHSGVPQLKPRTALCKASA